MPSPGSDNTQISILYVDDEPPLLEIARLFLERNNGVRVNAFETAHDALCELETRSYDVIVSDYQMPGMDGIAFLMALREKDNTTPFILFTGRGREEVVIKAFDAGADFYIQKGGDPRSLFTELERKVRRAVDLHRAERAKRSTGHLWTGQARCPSCMISTAGSSMSIKRRSKPPATAGKSSFR